MIAARIRRAGPADAEAVLPLIAAINAGIDPPARPLPAAVIARAYLDAGAPGFMLVAEAADGTLCGFVTADHRFDTALASPGLLIGDLFVADPARRRGIGRALMAHLAAAARERGARFLSWDADVEDAEAIAFYKAIGASAQPVVSHDLVLDAMDALASEAQR
jgi:GNAT superfamily N-acetyltransferase